ncbi:MAG: hypothetical protein V1808_00520 [Candidatus Daviesbacteria bacterium]
MKSANSYLKSHFSYALIVIILLGMGLGILITYPLVGSHPLRWGFGFLALGIAGYLYPLTIKKG